MPLGVGHAICPCSIVSCFFDLEENGTESEKTICTNVYAGSHDDGLADMPVSAPSREFAHTVRLGPCCMPRKMAAFIHEERKNNDCDSKSNRRIKDAVSLIMAE
jgi:hypothetical protein